MHLLGPSGSQRLRVAADRHWKLDLQMAAMQCSSGVSTSWHVRGGRMMSARTSSIMPSHGACCQQIPSNKKRCVVALLGQLRPSDSFLGNQRGFKIKETRRRTDRGLENGKVSAEGSALEKGTIGHITKAETWPENPHFPSRYQFIACSMFQKWQSFLSI